MSMAEQVRRVVRTLAATFPGAKRLVPQGIRHTVSARLYSWAMPSFPDRQYLASVIIPFICSRQPVRVLFVGCRKEQMVYWDLFAANGVEVWTIDIDPAAARWGVPARHIIGDVSALETVADLPRFGCILFNGVLGFGINDVESMRRTFVGFGRILAPGALLVIGWNAGHATDPREVTDLAALFDDLQDPHVPTRQTFEGSDHIYDFLLRNTTTRGV